MTSEDVGFWGHAFFWTLLATLVTMGVLITREACKNNDADGLLRVGLSVLGFAAVIGTLWVVFVA